MISMLFFFMDVYEMIILLSYGLMDCFFKECFLAEKVEVCLHTRRWWIVMGFWDLSSRLWYKPIMEDIFYIISGVFGARYGVCSFECFLVMLPCVFLDIDVASVYGHRYCASGFCVTYAGTILECSNTSAFWAMYF